MKSFRIQTGLLLIVLFIFNSCTTNERETDLVLANYKIEKHYEYSTIEKQTLDIINKYRFQEGLSALQIENHISHLAEEHIEYMIINDIVNHNGFVNRSKNIIQVLSAKKVGENVAYNYKTAEDVVKAWINSPTHRENIVGNFTHFGISIKQHPETNKQYYANIFAKL